MAEAELQSGASEMNNWFAAAVAPFSIRLPGGLVDYVPCCRSEAGIGAAKGWIVRDSHL